jgi:hypothetical protein
MKKSMYVLFAIAALMLAGGRLSAHSVTLSSNHSASVMQAADEPSTDPAGDPDGPGGPDGGPDGQGEGGPGAV